MTVADAAGTRASHWEEVVVRRIEPRTARITSLFFANTLRPFRPGQHVDLRLVAEDGYEARRSYSIASAPDDDDIELMVERLDDGEVSPFLHDELRVGDTLEWLGPVGGHFVWTVELGGPLLLVAGGSGIAPLMAMLRHRDAAAATVPVLLVYAARTWDALVYRDELLAMEDRGAGLSVVFALSREPGRRTDDVSGRLDAPRLRAVLERWDERPELVYVCGSTGFVEVSTSALVAEGIPASRIRTERYGGLA